MASTKKITLQSSDGESFEVDEMVANQSQLINDMIQVGCADSVIPVHKVSSNILAKVIEYCDKHVDLKAWDAAFVKVDPSTLCSLIEAANYLNIKSLLDLACCAVATNMIKGKTPEELRKIFDIKNDFTPEEEDEARLSTSRMTSPPRKRTRQDFQHQE